MTACMAVVARTTSPITRMAGEPMAPFKAFSHAMQENKLFEAIIAVMGFAFVMKLTLCDQHLIQALIKPLRKAGAGFSWAAAGR